MYGFNIIPFVKNKRQKLFGVKLFYEEVQWFIIERINVKQITLKFRIKSSQIIREQFDIVAKITESLDDNGEIFCSNDFSYW